MHKWDVFVCHASEDKERFVEPLANRLRDLAVRVWFDKHILKPGDRLSEMIADGLAQSRFGLLVFSKAFMGKPWTRYEMSGLVNRFVEEKTRLIPIWLGVGREDVCSMNPALADLFAITADPKNINAAALEILRTIRPQLYENLTFLEKFDVANVRVENRPLKDLKQGPIRHHDMDDQLLVRIQNLWFGLRHLINITLEDWIEGFQRDLRPEDEVKIWERILTAYRIVLDSLRGLDGESEKQALGILIAFSSGANESVFDKTEAGEYSQHVTYAVAHAWLNAVPPLTVTDVENTGE